MANKVIIDLDLPQITPGNNEFLTFGQYGSYPEMLMEEIEYRDNVRRKTGFAGGEPADNALMNTALRQMSMSLAGLCDFLAEYGTDIPGIVGRDQIKRGFITAVDSMVVKRLKEALQPILDKMQKQIDTYANAYHGIPVGGILPISCTQEQLSAFFEKYPYFALCDGQNGTVDLRDKFIMGTGILSPQGQIGGSRTFNNLEIQGYSLKEEELPSHKHVVPGSEDALDTSKWPFGAPIGSNNYAGASKGETGNKAYSSPVGGGKPHTHKVKDISKTGNIESGMLPPYISLIYVQKICPY